MPDPLELLELAERVENATGSDRNLDADIMRAVGQAGLKADYQPTPFTASLDAAMQLVPEGTLWRVNKWANGADASVAFVKPYREGPRCTAATPALALCAAALRALASQGNNNA